MLSPDPQAERDRAHLAQDRLRRVAQLATMGEMAAGIAHEINQPLTAITAYACACENYLAMPRPDLVELQRAVRAITEEGLRAGDMIRRLRQMVRSDRLDDRSSIAVNGIIEELRELLLADARAHGVDLNITLAVDLPCVSVDGVQLQHVVLNLARNAFEALQDTAPGQRRVEVATSAEKDGDVEIRVTDNGPGVAPRIAERLFEPFMSTKGCGTGLGLAISRTIVMAHGGTIGTRNAAPQGTTFYVRLPTREDCLR